MSSAPKIELSNVHETARQSAALRAAHYLFAQEPKIFSDNLAMSLSGVSEPQIAAMIGGVPKASAATCVLRSRFTEDRLAVARERLQQYVVLGAGLDSYALRQADGLGDLLVFEVDDPPFLEWKRQRIAELGLIAPSQLRYVPCDFEVTALPDALAASDFDPGRACFISWLGVTQYLTPEASLATLSWAGSLPSGTEIVLTFLERNEFAGNMEESMAPRVGKLTFFTPDEMSNLLKKAGFSQIEHMGEQRANEEYFRGRGDGLIAPQVQRLVSATV